MPKLRTSRRMAWCSNRVRKLLSVAVLVFLVWFFFIRPGSTEFGCEAAGAVARAANEECPPSVQAAAGDAKWAMDRLASIKDRSPTVGLFYDDEGNSTEFTSGEGDAAEYVDEVLHEQGVASPDAARLHPAATHAEAKAAAYMRDEGIPAAVMVINNRNGVCQGPYSCQSVLAKLLPPGATLIVWTPRRITAGVPLSFTGG